eukprot:6194550-Pleurochrysis_carterae.AAC.1
MADRRQCETAITSTASPMFNLNTLVNSSKLTYWFDAAPRSCAQLATQVPSTSWSTLLAAG